MRKIMDIICLVLWSMVLTMGIVSWCIGSTIHPLSYILVILYPLAHHIFNLIRGGYDD